MKNFFKNYNKVFLLMVISLLFLIQFFPLANKFDLVEKYSPVLMVTLFLTVGCVFGWLVSCFRNKGFFLKNSELIISILLSIFLVFSSFSFALSKVKTFGFTEINMLIVGILLFLYFSTVITNKKDSNLLQNYLPVGLSSLLLLNAVIGIYGFLTTDHLRFFGFFYNPSIKADAWPNAYALFFLLTFPILLYYFFYKKSSGVIIRNIKFVIVGFLIGTLFLSFSRAGFMAWMIEMIFMIIFVVFRSNQWRNTKFNFKQIIFNTFILFIFTISTVFGLQFAKSQIGNTTDISSRIENAVGGNSFTERLEFFKGSFKLIQEKPVFGHGPASFKWVYPHVQNGFLSLSDHPHNLFFKLAVERGIIASFIFLSLLLTLFIKINPFSTKTSIFQKIIWATLFGVFAHSMVDHNLNFINNYLILWLLLASLICKKNAQSDKTNYFSIILVFVLVCSIVITNSLIVFQTFKYKKMYSYEEISKEDISVFNPLLPRWWFFRLAEKTPNQSLKKIYIEKQIQINKFDSLAYIRLAWIYVEDKQFKIAEQLFKNAINVNPKNSFESYYGYAFCLQKQNKQAELNMLSSLLNPLFQEYQKLYDQNIHFTQSTNNMENIQKLKEIIDF